MRCVFDTHFVSIPISKYESEFSILMGSPSVHRKRKRREREKKNRSKIRIFCTFNICSRKSDCLRLKGCSFDYWNEQLLVCLLVVQYQFILLSQYDITLCTPLYTSQFLVFFCCCFLWIICCCFVAFLYPFSHFDLYVCTDSFILPIS